MTEAQAHVVRPQDGEAVQGPAGGPLIFKVRGEQTGGRLTALENTIAPGDGPPVHVHEAQDEIWLVLEGELEFRIGEEEADAPTGTFVYVPRGVPHAFRNPGDTPARLLVLFTPAGMERFFDAFAALDAGADIPAAFRALGAAAGMTIVGPPLGGP
ncbi:MAG: cupin domain-containing protein [Baekduiaceae bacterium]